MTLSTRPVQKLDYLMQPLAAAEKQSTISFKKDKNRRARGESQRNKLKQNNKCLIPGFTRLYSVTTVERYTLFFSALLGVLRLNYISFESKLNVVNL